MNRICRNTQGELISMKQNVLDACLDKTMLCKEGAKVLSMHKNAFSRLKRRYKQFGVEVLTPKKTGPKNKVAYNRTPDSIEKLVLSVARANPWLGPVPLAEELFDVYKVKLDPSTVWRILKRYRVRYTKKYLPMEKKKPQLYCLDEPGQEVQLDACYPFGRGRKIICFDAIDDCSRWVHAKIFEGTETTERAILFVKELVRVAPFVIRIIRIDNRLGKAFDRYCETLGIRVVRNNPYEPTQNGKIERYHRTVKYNFFWGKCGYYDQVENIGYKLQLWLGYYNNERRHGGLGMKRLTPQQKIAQIMGQKLYNLTYSNFSLKKVTLTLQSYNY
ncbi:MAG: transposase for ISMyma05 [Parcubacteria group bacterium GW2011_GWC2_38_7]|nr:MAG: transposase for ISMyma05 [Parcubacteria group bacterium GW2011_GWC2_38_7]